MTATDWVLIGACVYLLLIVAITHFVRVGRGPDLHEGAPMRDAEVWSLDAARRRHPTDLDGEPIPLSDEQPDGAA